MYALTRASLCISTRGHSLSLHFLISQKTVKPRVSSELIPGESVARKYVLLSNIFKQKACFFSRNLIVLRRSSRLVFLPSNVRNLCFEADPPFDADLTIMPNWNYRREVQNSGPKGPFYIGCLPIHISSIQLTIVFRLEMGSKQLCVAKLV